MLRLREGEREKRGRGREKGLMRFTKKISFSRFRFLPPSYHHHRQPTLVLSNFPAS